MKGKTKTKAKALSARRMAARSTSPRRPASREVEVDSINTPKAAQRFAKAAKRYTEIAVESEASAQSTLVALGIYTKGGRLTKHYR